MGWKKIEPGMGWKKGVTGNPKGRPPVKKIVKELREQLKDDYEKYVQELATLDKAQLKDIVKNTSGKETSIKQALASILLQAIVLGDSFRLETILNRIIGKVKEQVEVKSDSTLTVNFGFPRPERKE